MTSTSLEHDEERPVIEAVQQGDANALAELMQRHGRWVRGVIFGATGRLDEVDDIAQRVWMRVWRDARNLADPDRWRAWLYRIARNAATDAGRSRQRGQGLVEKVTSGWLPRTTDSPPPDALLIADEQQRLMLGAIAALPPLYREPFVLRHLEDWNYQQIGQALGLPVATVETRLVRARRLLRETLANRV